MRKIALSFFILWTLNEGALAQEPSGASSYLIGTYDLRIGRTTMLHIVNPTTAALRLFVAFFDNIGKFVYCYPDKLSADDLVEIDVQQVLRRADVSAFLGVVKVVSLADNPANVPQVGVVGNQQLNLEGQPVPETGLPPIQTGFWEEGELQIIKPACRF